MKRTIEQIIARSSLGTKEAVALRRAAPRAVVAKVLERVDELDHGAKVQACIVYPPRAGTGLRHVVVYGQDRALCGVNADGWYTEARTFNPATIGCLRCKAAWNRSHAHAG